MAKLMALVLLGSFWLVGAHAAVPTKAQMQKEAQQYCEHAFQVQYQKAVDQHKKRPDHNAWVSDCTANIAP